MLQRPTVKPRCHRVLSPTAILGYGFPEDSLRRGMQQHPDLIAVDAGSSDPGPFYLGSGKSFTSRAGVKRDLDVLLRTAVPASVPIIIGSAGGSGARAHVDWVREIIDEIASERGLSFKMAVIYADISKSIVRDACDAGRVFPVRGGPPLDSDRIERSTRIVAQMGSEPVLEALKDDPDVVLCGRAYDPVPFAAPAIQEGFSSGLALHMGKILECAAIAATPGSGQDCVMGCLQEECFILEALNPMRAFTSLSASAHTLYEKSNPYLLPGPGGSLDLRETRFTELGDGRVEVTGSRHSQADSYTVKLEGAAPAGYRTISIAGVRDPQLAGRIDSVLEAVRAQVLGEDTGKGQLFFHVYGRDAVMGQWEPLRQSVGHELGIVIEALCGSQSEADSLCSLVRSTLLHYGYPGRIATAGNLALLFSPSDISCGEVYEFSVYHLLEVSDPLSCFPIEYCEVRP
jgi:hypothetical protein